MVNQIKFNRIALGGTFDHFHKGHKGLLKLAFARGRFVIIGITSDQMVMAKPYFHSIESFTHRKLSVSDFVKQNKWGSRCKLVALTDPYGALGKDTSIEAVVVGAYYNKEVIASVEKKIAVLHAPVVYADDGKLLSSTRIRGGEIDREGKNFALPAYDLILPQTLRKTLQKPLGKLVKDELAFHIGHSRTRRVPLGPDRESIQNNNPRVPPPLKAMEGQCKPEDDVLTITVGDVATKRLLGLGIVPDIAIVDFYVQRVKKYSSLQSLGFLKKIKVDFKVKNPAGVITKSLSQIIFKSLEDSLQGKKRIILVDGEEDLATLIVLYRAPLGANIFYGQPAYSGLGEGLVRIRVTEENKTLARFLLSKFTHSAM